MTDFALLSTPSDWLPELRRRLVEAYRANGLPAGAAEAFVDQRAEKADGWTAAAVLDADGRRVGQVVLSTGDEQGRLLGRIRELWTDPALDPDGAHRRAALAWARGWCAEQGAYRISVGLTAPDELFADYPVRGQARLKDLTDPAEVPAGASHRPLTEAEYEEWVAEGMERYAGDILRAGSGTPEQARRKAEEDYRQLLPQGRETEQTALVVLEADGEAIGHAWLKHQHLPGVSYGYSLDVAPRFRGRGHGRAAMALGEQAVRAAGDRALMFTVWGGNEVAMNLYTATGYRVLEETRSQDL
ncbi:GNAT family N-acetyltransferase [Kitasatospora viridis]|uniref:Acetyltransferase (GNAT) family protein n=1 Tax=Kitasatospora viridis TaxID=281105 RepID=A0A561T6P7_9ACTN|nr:GNAT family N-acetyltransferase [Kitasatospora viridis]TWF82793.1 acetyltransferase (GNAT) family protein [Kitasatospora viridis]